MKCKKVMIKDIKNSSISLLILNHRILKNKNFNNKMNNKIKIKIYNKNKRNKSRNLREEAFLKATKKFMTHENKYFYFIFYIFNYNCILLVYYIIYF